MHDPMHWPSFFCGVLTGVGCFAGLLKFLRGR